MMSALSVYFLPNRSVGFAVMVAFAGFFCYTTFSFCAAFPPHHRSAPINSPFARWVFHWYMIHHPL